MENKKLDEKSLEQLVKIVDAFRDFTTNLADEISKVSADIKAFKEEDTWETKCPYKVRDAYWLIQSDGKVASSFWLNRILDEARFEYGNTFSTEQAAELEAKRRNLLTRFRAFRDECNGDWKPDWSSQDKKWEIDCDYQGLKPLWINKVNGFSTFGHFENEEDCKRAIKLFGDEIKELFVDCEV